MYRNEPTRGGEAPRPGPPRGPAGSSTLHPTPPHLGDDLKRDDSRLWQLLDLLTSSNSSQVLHEVVRCLVSVLEADEVALYAGHAPALLMAAYGRQRVAEQHLVDHRMSDALAGRTTVALLPKDHEGAWRVGKQTFIRSGLWVPSTDETMTPALVRALRVRPEHFPAGSRRLLSVVVRRLAAVLHHIQQQRYDRARDTERTQLFHVSASITQELDFELVAERVVVGVTSVTDFANATVEVRDGTALRRVAAFGSDDLDDHVTSPMALWQKALVDEHSVGELSYRVAMRNALPVRADDGADATAGLVTQLQDRDGDVLGFLTLSRPRAGVEPTEQMVQTIELFARQAQIALVNAALYREAQRQRDIAQTLMRVTSAVSRSLETDEILATCCEAAQSHSVGERAAIYLFDEHGHVTLATSRGRDELPPSAHGPLLVADDPLLTESVQSPTPIVVDDLAASARYADSWISRELGLHSVAIYALRAGEDTLGLLVVDSHTTKVDFAEHEAALLSQIAAQAAVALRQSSLHAQTREQAARNAQLLELTTAMTTTFEFKAIFERIVNAVRTRMDGHAMSVLRVNSTDIQVLGSITDDHLRCPSPPPRMPMSDQLRNALRLVWEGGTLRLDDVRVYPALSQIARPETRSVVLAAPLDRRETDVLLTVSTTKAGAFSRGDERFLADLVRVTKLAVRNADLFVDVSEAAKRDPLTGLLNRRVFWETLERHLADIGPRTLALAVVDADDFKLINDRLGHTVGDAALRHIADRLQRSVRETDQVFRIGGEEFTIVMPDASDDDAHGVMTRVLAGVRQSRADLPPLSVSIGVAIAPDDGKSVDELFREADHALLRAKRNGKGRITLRSDVA